jgi:hypothetical protein
MEGKETGRRGDKERGSGGWRVEGGGCKGKDEVGRMKDEEKGRRQRDEGRMKTWRVESGGWRVNCKLPAAGVSTDHRPLATGNSRLRGSPAFEGECRRGNHPPIALKSALKMRLSRA